MDEDVPKLKSYFAIREMRKLFKKHKFTCY